MKVKSLRFNVYGRGTMSSMKMLISNTRSANVWQQGPLAQMVHRMHGTYVENRAVDHGWHGCCIAILACRFDVETQIFAAIWS